MFELGKLWRNKGNNEQALALFQQAEQIESADKSPQLMLSMGQVLEDMEGRSAEAISYYMKASDNAASLQPQNQGIHLQLQMVFEAQEREDLAKQESDWLERYRKAQEERGMPRGGLGGGSFTVE